MARETASKDAKGTEGQQAVKERLSLAEEISLLEGKIAGLNLTVSPTGEGSSGGREFPAAVQNELKTILKGAGTFLGEVEDTQELRRIHTVLQAPLLPHLQPSPSKKIGDGDVSSLLSYLKLLSEACPVPVQQADAAKANPSPPLSLPHEDRFWKRIIEPVFKDILKFLNAHVIKRGIAKLSSSVSCLDLPNALISSTHHGTGFAFHQQLGLLQKGVRILLVYLKRATSNLSSSSVVDLEGKKETDAIILGILLELCTLMKPSRSEEIKTDFDIGLDIRCNIGIGMCYSIYYLRHTEKDRVEKFFKLIFSSAMGAAAKTVSVTGFEKDILDVLTMDVNRISVAFGILNTWLEQEHDKDLYNDIGSSVLELEHGVKEGINLGSSRVMEIWSEKLSRPCVPSSILLHVSSLFPPLEFFCFMYMPGHIDAVKNCCRNVISALARIYDRLDEEGYLPRSDDMQQGSWVANFLHTILEKPMHIKWIPLACVAKNTEKSMKALELHPGLPEDLLTAQRTYKSAANDTYVALMSYQFHKPDFNLAAWEKIWIDPLFATQFSTINESNWPQKKSIISIILNSEKLRLKNFQDMIQPLLISIVKRMNRGTGTSESTIEKSVSAQYSENLSEAALLAAEAIKMAHELRIAVNIKELSSSTADANVEEDSFRGLVPRSILHNWLWNENPQIRLAGLSLLVETKKTTEEFSERDFGSLKIFFKYNLHSQNPAFRQQFIAYFKKFVRRLKDGESSTRRNKNAEAVQRYHSFLQWLWNFLTEEEGLFPGANFGRRCQALECLSELIQSFPNLKVFGLTDSGNLKYLRWLTDSYENNKIKAMEILARMPINEFGDEQFCKNLFNEAITLCKSVKPPDSVTGRYLMTLLMQKSSKTGGEGRLTPLAILEALYSELETMYRKAESTSLILVASESPMYGCLRCIRMILLNTTDYKQKENSVQYRQYVCKLVKLCFNIDYILFPVLGSAAPEGFLPGLKDSAPEENKQVVRSLSAQMLLVCAWRSMKEISLLLADMCTLFKMEGESSPLEDLLTFQQVSEIGNHLLYLLKNLMHRGVFEQVYVGFKQLASRLWKSTSHSLSRLPEKWLQDAMDQEHISSKSITRRSAGLPFIFQALLSPECDNEAFLLKWVQRLLILDESPEMNSTRIHSMNVLRGLFRDASFSSAMMQFVPHGLKMAFQGLKSNDWTERNAGLMLYGAVMRRSFGAKLNLMNAPTFFRKFPQMYDFLLTELDICIGVMEEKEKQDVEKVIKDMPQNTCDFTFHLLLLLSCFTASCRMEDSHFKLEVFISRIRKCGYSSHDMEVRKLSAKALVPFLVSAEDKRALMVRLLRGIESSVGSGNVSQNRLHGRLCQFLTVSLHLPREDTLACKEANEKITTSFLSFLSSTPLDSLRAPTVFEVVMNILQSLNSLGCLKKGVVWDQGVNPLLKRYDERFGKVLSRRNTIPGLPVADTSIANSTIQIKMDSLDADSFTESVYNYFKDSSLRSRTYIEEFFELFQEEDGRIRQMLFGGRSDDNILVLVEAVMEHYLERISSEFRKFPATKVELGYLKFFEAVPHSLLTDVEEATIRRLIKALFDLCDESQGKGCTSLHIRATAFTILGNLLFSAGFQVSQEYQTTYCDLAIKWSASSTDDDMRFAVAESFPKVPFPNMKHFSGINQAKLWASIFILAQDDEGEIRQIINRKLSGAAVGKPVCDRKSLEELCSLFFKQFVVHHPLEGLIMLLGLLQRSDLECEVKAADDETEDRLFDRSEMNMFFESEILAKVILAEMALDENSRAFGGNGILDFKLTKEQIILYQVLLHVSPDDDEVLTWGTLREICFNETELTNSVCNKLELDNSDERGGGVVCNVGSGSDSTLDKRVLEFFHFLGCHN